MKNVYRVALHNDLNSLMPTGFNSGLSSIVLKDLYSQSSLVMMMSSLDVRGCKSFTASREFVKHNGSKRVSRKP